MFLRIQPEHPERTSPGAARVNGPRTANEHTGITGALLNVRIYRALARMRGGVNIDARP